MVGSGRKSCTLTLIQMKSLYRDPDGESVFSKTSPTFSHSSLQTNKESLKENERIIESLRNRVKELETSLGKSDSDDCENNGRKLSISKVTFSEVKTLIIENGRSHTSSVSGSLDNVADDVQNN